MAGVISFTNGRGFFPLGGDLAVGERGGCVWRVIVSLPMKGITIIQSIFAQMTCDMLNKNN